MTGGIYDHLLIVGTFCSFIQGMTNAYFTTYANVINRNSEKDFKRRSETDRCGGIGYPQKMGPTKDRKGLMPPKRTEKNIRAPKRTFICHFIL